MRSLAFVRVDRHGRVHDDHGQFSAVIWRATDRLGRRVSLTRAALRHARGEDETERERRTYIDGRVVKATVERGRRYADMTDSRERLIANDMGPSAHLVVVIEVRAETGTVVTAYAMRRIPNAWRHL